MSIDLLEIVALTRTETSDHGTFGQLSTQRGFSCFIGEPPDRNNKPNLSCIPVGRYRCDIRISPKYGKVYHVKDVPGGRTFVLTHSGNVCGDTTLGYHTHTLGCLLVGKYLGSLVVRGRKQRAVLCSRPTFRKFMNHMNGRSFFLDIKESF